MPVPNARHHFFNLAVSETGDPGVPA